jgi:acyl-CoA reductase-like NAD-dependent aldehyde dehydrogenase
MSTRPRIDKSGVIPPTPQAELDAAVDELEAHKDLWMKLDLNERISILDQILLDLHAVNEEWVTASIQAKGLKGNNYGEAEEWALMAYVYRTVRLLGESLRDIQRHARPQIPGPIDTLPNGQVRAQVFPVDRYDSMVFSGMTAEVWMQPGTTIDQVLDNQARFYRDDAAEGQVALVLGAGNTSMLIPTDFMHKLFVEGKVVVLKMNPVNDYLGPIIEEGFRALIDRNFLRVVYGGAKEGNYLCHHPGIDELHMTGSDKTFDLIVFGPGEEGARRKAQRQPLIKKPFTSELGNVTPVIVVPGPWREEEIEDWGEKLARWLIINAGFNCLTPRVIIQAAGWDRRQDLLQAVAKNLAQIETRKAYYPGTQKLHKNFLTAHPNGQQHGKSTDGKLPWTLIQDVDANNTDDICFKNESFCGLFAETALDAEDVPAFLESAVSFANEHLWGNLTATLVVHPDSLQDPEAAQAVENAIADLRYGTVLINQYAALGFFAMTTPWGAYPGNDIYDIQSGIGVTTNSLMFASPQKSVIRNPFKVSPDPLSLHSRTVVDVSRKLADLQYHPSPWKVPGMLWSAIRS